MPKRVWYNKKKWILMADVNRIKGIYTRLLEEYKRARQIDEEDIADRMHEVEDSLREMGLQKWAKREVKRVLG